MSYKVRDIFSQKRFGDTYEGKHMYSLELIDGVPVLIYNCWYNFDDKTGTPFKKLNPEETAWLTTLEGPENSKAMIEDTFTEEGIVWKKFEKEGSESVPVPPALETSLDKLIFDEHHSLQMIDGFLCYLENCVYKHGDYDYDDEEGKSFYYTKTGINSYLYIFRKGNIEKWKGNSGYGGIEAGDVIFWEETSESYFIEKDTHGILWDKNRNMSVEATKPEEDGHTYDFIVADLYDGVIEEGKDLPEMIESQIIDLLMSFDGGRYPKFTVDISKELSDDTLKKLHDSLQGCHYSNNRHIFIEVVSKTETNEDVQRKNLSKIISYFEHFYVKVDVLHYYLWRERRVTSSLARQVSVPRIEAPSISTKFNIVLPRKKVGSFIATGMNEDTPLEYPGSDAWYAVGAGEKDVNFWFEQDCRDGSLIKGQAITRVEI